MSIPEHVHTTNEFGFCDICYDHGHLDGLGSAAALMSEEHPTSVKKAFKQLLAALGEAAYDLAKKKYAYEDQVDEAPKNTYVTVVTTNGGGGHEVSLPKLIKFLEFLTNAHRDDVFQFPNHTIRRRAVRWAEATIFMRERDDALRAIRESGV